jgi:hypothetical protein
MREPDGWRKWVNVGVENRMAGNGDSMLAGNMVCWKNNGNRDERK